MGIVLPPPPPPPAADAFAIYAYGDERLPPTMAPMLPPPTPLTGLSHREKLEAMRALRQQNDEQTRQALASARR